MSETERLRDLIARAKTVAHEYYALTGRPLGITGEVAEVAAIEALGLEIAPVRQAGYDAVRRSPDGALTRYQIKGRCVRSASNPGQRIGRIQPEKEWDAVLVVLLDEKLDLREILEAPRDAVIAELTRPGSRARNELGALGLQTFRRIATRVWPTEMPQQQGPQDRQTGAAGNRFGRETAPKIAAALGAEMLGPSTNEAQWRGSRVVIKCARSGTSSIGVTKAMLERIDAVLAAFQRLDGRFDVYELPASEFKAKMRESRSAGHGSRVGLVSHRVFERHGNAVGTASV